MSLWLSLTGRLFRQVFGWYVVLAIIVTSIQLGLEYFATQQNIQRELESLGNSFARSAADALWTFDRPQLAIMTQGLVQNAIISGARIEDANGKKVAEAGAVPNSGREAEVGLLAAYQRKEFFLGVASPRGEQDVIGQLVLFSSRSIIIERIQYSFIIILINSLIKTAGLWLIFYLVISKGLSRPLSRVTEVVSRMEFAANSPNEVSLNYAYDDELGRLMNAMRTMQTRLSTARAELAEVNHNLELTVEARTAHLAELSSFNEAILMNSPLAMGVYAADGQCVMANEAYATLVGATREQLIAQNFMKLASWQESGLLEGCLDAVAKKAAQQRNIHLVTSFGKEVWLDCRISLTSLNGTYHLLIQLIDQTERMRHEEELQRYAFLDPLTQLPNRRLLLDRITQVYHASKRNGNYFAVIYFDLNKFKLLNDTHGHDIGDQFLVQVALRVRQSLRDCDTLARLGGDEFVVVVEDLGTNPDGAADRAGRVVRKIREALSGEFLLGGMAYCGSASIGMKVSVADETDIDDLLKEADAAMYAEKRGDAAARQTV